MAIILQKKRLLITDFEDEDALKTFIKYITVTKQDMYFNETSSWAAGFESTYEGRPVMAVPRRFNTEVLNNIISEDDSETIKDNSNDIPPRYVEIGNEAEPRNDLQKDILAFLQGTGGYKSLAKKPRKALFADTGVGKTFLTLKYASLNGYFALINCPDEKAILTWQQEIAKFTDIKPEEIGYISGRESLNKLVKNRDKYKIVLGSSKTFSSLFLSKDFTIVEEFFNNMQFSLLVHDEVHLNLLVVFYLEMIASTKRTLYLTATPNRRMFKEQKILESLMPTDNCIYATEKKERFLYIEGRYYTNGEKAEYKGIVKPNGTDYNTYSKMITFAQTKDRKAKFHDFFMSEVLLKSVKYALKQRSNPDNKVAILCKSKAENEIIFTYLKKELGDKYTIGVFNSDIKDIDIRFKETEANIIISTDKSFAGIINIPKLEVIINLYPYSSIAHVQQIMGRIREEEAKGSIFIQLVDGSVSRIKKAGYRCRTAAKEICAVVEYKEFNKAEILVHEEED